MNISVLSLTISVTVIAMASPAQAVVTSYTNFSQWQSAAGSFTSIAFTKFPAGDALSTEYSAWGVTFTGPHDVLIFDPGTFSLDGRGVVSFDGMVELAFAQPISSIGAHYIGGVQYKLYSQGALIETSGPFFGFGGSFFAGIVSSQPFDAAIIYRADVPHVSIDDLYFGRPIPAPAALPLLGLGLILVRRRA